jgi:ribosomal protein L11 methyltransferase
VIRLAVRVERAHSDQALADLLVLAPAGLEEVEIDEHTIEYVLYGCEGELPGLPALEASIGEALVTVSTSEIADDWSERWRVFHQPIAVADRLYVRPPWHQPASGLLDVVIDPGQAFGTGAHATTRLCLELLVEIERAGGASGALLDIGCGSGVLAIAAAKLGYAPVAALDLDPVCIEATQANAAANGVTLEARQSDLRADPLPPTATIVANLLLGPLLELSKCLEHSAAVLIASGLLASQGDELAADLGARHGLHEHERRFDSEWLAMLFAGADPRVSS